MEPVILIKYPSRSRPSRFEEGLESILNLSADPHHLIISFTLDDNDPQLEKYNEVIDRHAYKGIIFHTGYGTSANKIDAVNRSMPRINWDITLNFSDDMKFVVYGWDHLVREGVRCNGPDVFLHYPDSTAKQMLPTISVMDRVYYERDRYFYHPSYKSLWCDNEAMDVAKLRGRYRYLGIQIYDHYHPAYGHVPWDEQYEQQQRFWGEDEKNYYDRKANKFYLNATELTDPDGNGTTLPI